MLEVNDRGVTLSQVIQSQGHIKFHTEQFMNVLVVN